MKADFVRVLTKFLEFRTIKKILKTIAFLTCFGLVYSFFEHKTYRTCEYATNELRNELRGTQEQQRTIKYEINLIKQQIPTDHNTFYSSGDGEDLTDDEDYRQTVHKIQSASDLQTNSLRKNMSRLENAVYNLQVKINTVRTESNQKHHSNNRVIQRMST